jgi:ribosomal small subunit protein bTHX
MICFKVRHIHCNGILLTFASSFKNTVVMGKGDKKTKRGKLFMGSYGVTRPQKSTPKPVKAETK